MTPIQTILHSWRSEMGYSIRQMAELLGTSKYTLTKWERGERNPPKIAVSHIALLQALQSTAPLFFQAWADRKTASKGDKKGGTT